MMEVSLQRSALCSTAYFFTLESSYCLVNGGDSRRAAVVQCGVFVCENLKRGRCTVSLSCNDEYMWGGGGQSHGAGLCSSL